MLLDGLHVPLTVPFYRDGTVYLRKLEHNVGRLSLTPAAALVALGFGSEAQALSDEETVACLRVVAETAAKDKVLVARIERGSVAAALSVAEAAAAAAFDAILLPAPAPWQHPQGDAAGSLAALYFRSVADRSPLPVILWSGDGSSHARLSVAEAAELAAHPNVLGLYDVALDAARFRTLQEATEDVRREVVVTPVFAPVTGRMLRVEAGEGKADFVPAASLGGGVALASAPPAPAAVLAFSLAATPG